MADYTLNRATPEQWAMTEYLGNPQRTPGPLYDASCLLELRDRLAAVEQRISELESAENYRQQDEDAERAFGSMSGRTAPPPLSGSLVEAVANALDPEDPPCYHVDAARAAILACADWLDSVGNNGSARELREEVERHG